MDVESSGDLHGRHGGAAPTQPSGTGSGGAGGLPVWWHPDSLISRVAASVVALGAALMGLLQVGLAVASGVGGNWGEVATHMLVAAFFGFWAVQIWRLFGGGRTSADGDRGGQGA